MFQRNFNCIRVALIALFVLTPAQFSQAAFKEGDLLPALGSFNLEGKLPGQLKGHVILLDFWASWCGPCRKSFPVMQDLRKQFAGQGLMIVAVSVDENPVEMDRFLKSANVSFPTVRDARHKLVATADIAAMPTSFLIDRAGKIRFVHKGFFGDETVKQYREQINLLLKEPAP
ncbi:MAG TPA: TlpA disulfide reductase family protein [Humisphaera sp.]|nr:TlpA disulfide reductase family protein [Humisphaera sp.]